MSFADEIARFAAKTRLSMDTIVRKVVLDVGTSLIDKSPVDTGRFRGNWFLGINAVNETTTEETESSQSRINVGVEALKAGGVVYITNSLPYAIPLEYGHSDQAPNGMVRLTVVEYQQYITNAVRSLR